MVTNGLSWWRQPCPARGPGLTHVHSMRCVDPAHDGACCECGERPNTRVGVSQPPAEAPPVPFDVTQRLKDMGLITGDGPRRTDHADDELVEPKYITGQGPQGRPDGPGRGELHEWQKELVLARVRFGEWLSRHGGGESA